MRLTLKNPIDDVREFSNKTGIRDPVLDTMLNQQASELGRMASWPTNTSTATTSSAGGCKLNVDACREFMEGFSNVRPANKCNAVDAEWHIVPEKELLSGESLE
jgi:hypothetical protein